MKEKESVNKLNNWKSECRIEKNEKTFDDRNLIVNIYNSFDVCVWNKESPEALRTVQLRARSFEGILERCKLGWANFFKPGL